MSMSVSDVGQGDVLVLDVAVFHRAGVDGTCHIEDELAYVVMDDPSEGDALCVLTVEQEEALETSIAGVVKTLSLDISGGVDGIERHENVYAFRSARQG